MSPATIALIMGLLELAIKEEPAIAADLREILSKEDPTPADWLAMKNKRLAVPFEELAPDAKTTPDEPQAPV